MLEPPGIEPGFLGFVPRYCGLRQGVPKLSPVGPTYAIAYKTIIYALAYKGSDGSLRSVATRSRLTAAASEDAHVAALRLGNIPP